MPRQDCWGPPDSQTVHTIEQAFVNGSPLPPALASYKYVRRYAATFVRVPGAGLGVNDNVLGHFHRLFPAATDAAMSSNRARDTRGTCLVLLLAKDQWLLEWCASTLGWFGGTAYEVTNCRGTFGGKDLTFAVLNAQPSNRNLSIITPLSFTITGYRVILFSFLNRSALWNKSADDGARSLVYERMSAWT